jgi:hypothetical protein
VFTGCAESGGHSLLIWKVVSRGAFRGTRAGEAAWVSVFGVSSNGVGGFPILELFGKLKQGEGYYTMMK